jgi:type II secretory pathway pseudopilin PulG
MICQFGMKLKLSKNPMKNSQKLNFFPAGLTFVEMIVSVSIIAFITAIFVTNYNTTNKRTDIVMSAQALVSDIHQAQNNSLGLLKYGDEVPAGGWGIHFDKAINNKYILFADLNAPGESGYRDYSADEGDPNKGARVVSLPTQTEISALRVYSGANTNPVESASVTFLPPDPRTNIYSSGATSTALEIDIKELRGNTIKTIKVNFLGLAEVTN